MKKYLIYILLVLIAVGVFIYFFLDKDEYTPSVVYEEDVKWEDIEKTYLTFDGSNVTADGEGVVIDNNIVTIKSGGSYYLSGNFEGQIIVDSSSIVYLIMDNFNITYLKSSPIYIKNATKVIINLNNTNSIIDGNNYEVADEDIDASIYSKSDLVFMGEGSLNIDANYNHGIKSKDTLQIISGNINIDSVNDGIIGKDYLAIKNGNITINSSSDGIKSTNDTDTSLGYIIIDDGTFNITSSGDAIQSETSITINNGTFNIVSGGGSSNASTKSGWGNWGTNTSAKGIKSNSITINDGVFNINSSDDSIHSNGTIKILKGTFKISSGDDGIHADESLELNGDINITKSYEGIESEEIVINSGNINVISSDDGLNAAGGNDSSSLNRPGANNMGGTGNININGGTIYINAIGDGIDSNGSVSVSGGIIIVNGPLDNGNGALDYDSTFKMTGGTLIASGSSGMAQNISNSSTQYGVSITFNNTISSETLISLYKDNEEIITYSASKNYQNVIICSSDLSKGEYTIYTGGTSKNNTNGLYEIGDYSGGTKYTTFTISSILTNVGSNNRGGMMRR